MAARTAGSRMPLASSSEASAEAGCRQASARTAGEAAGGGGAASEQPKASSTKDDASAIEAWRMGLPPEKMLPELLPVIEELHAEEVAGLAVAAEAVPLVEAHGRLQHPGGAQ